MTIASVAEWKIMYSSMKITNNGRVLRCRVRTNRATMRMLGMALIFVVLFNTPSWAQSDDDFQQCSPAKKDPDLTVHFCSILIESGELSERNLPIAFNNRGVAYSGEDVQPTIRINPISVDAKVCLMDA